MPKIRLLIADDQPLMRAGFRAVLEATGELTPVAADPHDATVDLLVAYYKAGNGEHDNWDEYRAAMVADGRLILTVHPERVYGLVAN